MRIAFCDLHFHWPPIGGGMGHMKEIMNRTVVQHKAKLFVLDWPYFFPRGKIDDPLGEIKIEYEHISPGRFGFFPNRIARLFFRQVLEYKPDLIFLGAGHLYNLYLADLFSQHYPTVVRFFAYEFICPRNSFLVNRETLYCQNDYFHDPRKCVRCTFGDRDGLKNLEAWLSGLFIGDKSQWAKDVLGRCARLIVNNHIAAERLEGINPNIEVVTPGVDCGLFVPKPKDKNKGPVVLAVGQFNVYRKGIETVFDACKRLWDEGQEFTLLTVGGRGKLPEHPFVENIPMVRYNEMPRIYPKADFVLVPSLWQEPFGKVAIEAMACGKAVIASSVGGLKGIFKDGQAGILAEPGDVNGWAQAIKRLLLNPGEREEMGRRGIAVAKERYDWTKIMKNYRFEEML